MRTRTLSLLLVLFCLLPAPSVIAAAPTASGPDADGIWTLSYDIAVAGDHHALLDVLREDADGSRAGTRDLGAVHFVGPQRYEVSFLPAEGAGRYQVGLLLDEVRIGEAVFDVADAGTSSVVYFDIPDSPTSLALANDTVNADGKVKSPGEALITRATLADDNGVAELDGVTWTVTRAGSDVDSGTLSYAAGPNATSVALELRYDRAPLGVGDHTLTLRAVKAGQTVANASRTFFIREVAATFLSGTLPNITPDDDRTLAATVILADKNGVVGPGTLESRVYRGSTRVEGQGLVATLGIPSRLPDAEGAARWSYPLALQVPARAAPGAHRVSVYLNDSLLGTMPFEVLALPTLRSVEATTQSGRLVLAINATGEGILTARIDDGEGASSTVTTNLATSNITLEPIRRGAPLRWSVTMRAREGGMVLDERNGTWVAPFDGPALALAPVHVRGRLPAVWALDAGGWDMQAVQANVTFSRWDGVAEPTLRANVSDGRVHVDAPRTLAAGRYQARLLLTWANGSASEATWVFDAGPWVELSLAEPVVEGRNATVVIHNGGGLAVSRLVVETESAMRMTLRVGNATLSPVMARERGMFAGFSLAPGADAQLRIELPAGPMPSGARHVALRVLARVEVG